MDFCGSSRTKRRRIKAKVAEHLQMIENFCLENNPSQSANLNYVTERESQIPDDLDSQIFFAESGQESESSVLSNDSSEELNLDSIVEERDSSNDVKRILAEWAANRNISHGALSELLLILIKSGLDLPKDPRTLLSTLKSCEVKEIGDGSYYHFGVANALISLLSKESHVSVDTLTLRVNIDGLPLFRSSKMELWPILAKVKELAGSDVVIIGLYAGSTKPDSVQEYLKDFIQDLKLLTQEGLHYNGKHYNVALPDAFICDAPARAFLKCTKGHSGYSSCERCTEHGVHIDNKVVFPDLSSPLRTDLEFDRMVDEEHHRGVSPLQELGIGMVSCFVLDYMHLVCLGNIRKLVSLWIKGPFKMSDICSHHHRYFTSFEINQRTSPKKFFS